MFYIILAFLYSITSGDLVDKRDGDDKKYLIPGALGKTPADTNGNYEILREGDTSKAAATEKCIEFYDKRGENDNGVSVSKLGEGGQSRVYKCETNTANSDLPAVAVKLYKRPWEFRILEREMVDTQLGELGIGPKVYYFFYELGVSSPSYTEAAGKIEDLLTGDNVGYDNVHLPEVYRHVAKSFAQVHSIKQEDMDLVHHFENEMWPWNTQQILDHFNQEWFLPGHEPVWKMLKMNSSDIQAEFNFADNKIRESKTPTTFCHNDPHPENMMVEKDTNGNYKWETFYLIDFDNAAWGYRAWDIDYYFSKWPAWPSTEVMEDFLDSYLEEYTGSQVATKAEIMTELRLHQPYLLLEQMLFYYAYFGNTKYSRAQLDAYCDVMLNYFDRPVTCGANELSMSIPVIILSVLAYLTM